MPPNLPPGPKYPGLVMVYLSARHTQATLERSQKRFGEIFTFRVIRGTKIIFVSDPPLIEQLFNADPDVLIGDRGIVALVGKNSLPVVSGEGHTRARKLLAPPFHADHVQRYRALMERICREEIDGWPLRQPVQLYPRLENITLGVVVSAVFGVQGGPELEPLHAAFSNMLAYRDKPVAAAMFNVMPRGSKPPKSFQKVIGAYDAEVYKAIERARQDPRLEERDDILAMLVRAHHDDGSATSDEEIRDHVTTLLIQGHVSTATATSWTLERLVRHPEALEKLRAEAQTDSEEYLDAVIKETLRLRPPVPVVMREVAKPFPIGEYELEPGNLVGANGFGVQRREDLYPEPLEFRPERWFDQEPGKYTWIPFGGGPRHCIGRNFATLEMKVVLRTLMQQFRFATTDQPGERSRRRGIGWIPADGAKVVLEERTKSSDAAPARV
jgi:cytochrome P450